MTAHRKPRLALMGEFSAGKSTLTNLLLGSAPLPTRVTATRLPPVWLSHGEGTAQRVDAQGQVHDIKPGELGGISPDSTRLVRLGVASEMLELCDLIDLPGISDPNMPAELWQSLMDETDQVIWCTHATQAWRQSEAAAWDNVRDRAKGPNVLLITQIDKLTTERDRNRVMARVKAETEGLFDAYFAISLTQALSAGDDVEQWEQSGAHAFTNFLIDALLSHGGEVEDAPEHAVTPSSDPVQPTQAISPKRVRNRIGERLRTRPVNPGFDNPILRDLKVAGGTSV
ncbi:MAG: dynamin family protein [Paracoccaceae bacterium]